MLYFIPVMILLASPDLWSKGSFNDRPMQQKDIEKQRMEEDISAAVGGAGSGMTQKQRQEEKEKARHEEDKEKMLYEYDGRYRKGL